MEEKQKKPYTVRLFLPEDAPGITRLFRAVYGDGYPVRFVYSPEKIIEAYETGASYSVIAANEGGEIIAQCALFRSAPYHHLYESGAGLVLPEYRKLGIMEDILYITYNDSNLFQRLGIEELWGEAVCNHVYMQIAVSKSGTIEMALEVDLMPAEAYEKEKSSSGRVASLVIFRSYHSRPHDIYFPPVYEDTLRWLYDGLNYSRRIRPASDDMPRGKTALQTQVFDISRVARVTIEKCGEDLETGLQNLTAELEKKNIAVTQVWLKLSWPWVGRAVEILRGMGFFLGGPLPRWFDDDGLLMQRVHGYPNWEGIKLHSDRSKRLLDDVFADWRATAGNNETADEQGAGT